MGTIIMKKKILVIAPRFPAINQPWMDTYLEQLLVNKTEILIYSAGHASGPYHHKVDELNLLAKVIRFPVGLREASRSVFLTLLNSPCKIMASFREAMCAASGLSRGASNYVASVVRLIFFRTDRRMPTDIALIHAHSERYAYEFLYLACVQKIPLLLTFHGLPPTGIDQLASDKRMVLYRRVALVLVNTKFAKNQVVALGCSPSKVVVLPQGLPVKDFPFVLRAPPQAGGELKVLSVGRFHRDKGQAYSLLALLRLLRNGCKVHWYFVGVGPDLDRLKSLAARLGIASHVSFLNGISAATLSTLYHECHLFVLGSTDSGRGDHVETQGVVLQEAQASGCIPIASNVGGIPECITDGVDGFLVPQKSSKSIVKIIEQLLASSVEEWTQYQYAGRALVERKFSSDIVGLEMVAILRALSRVD